LKLSKKSIEIPIKGEIYSVERLEEYAAYLATELKITDNPKTIHTLLPRMRENGKKLLASYRSLTDAIHRKETIPPAAEWLTDNFHIVEDQLREIQEDLPPSYYQELPKISLGELAGYPRIYAIALALIAHTDSQLEPDIIRRFVQSYQSIAPLSIGELWALPITLRLVLVENLRRIAVRIVLDHAKRNQANDFADELFKAVSNKEKFQALVVKLPLSFCEGIQDDCAFIAQVAKRLRDQEAEIWPALESLERHLAKGESSTEQVVNYYHQLQAANQVTVANVITSMRLLSSLNWRDFFESLSPVDRILEKDSIYRQMDFPTRDRYRHVIEKVGKQTGVAETAIAEKVIQLAREAQKTDPGESRQAHVGYYLINRGVRKLEEQFNFKTSFRILDFGRSHPSLVYFSVLGFFLATVLVAPLWYSAGFETSFFSLVGIGLLILIPCSSLALSLTNFLLTHTVRPKILPKLDFSSGIPQNARSMVVIPCMLSGASVIQSLLEKIEIHYLGNADQELYFGLLTDFSDAPKESLPEDTADLKAIQDGIVLLNQKYADKNGDRFFLFHRRRRWNQSENTWMGWERKRGKINEFNRLLRGDKNTSFSLVTAPLTLLPTIRFVITLDADTQLPRETAQKMIGAIMHPLNQPRFDQAQGRVVEGHGVLQPRVGISLESSTRSPFAKIFSGFTGIDPYTTAVSDVYQDLFHEGIYTGKGIYDVDAFEASLERRVPENTVLSHDLFEGLFARAGFLSDVEVLDDYPQTYHSFFTRQHRWTRGDWQIASWIWTRNGLPLISRWKIFDNLRRSLVAPSTFLWFILTWTFFPGSHLFWTGLVLVIVILPCLVHDSFSAVTRLFGRESQRSAAAGGKIKLNLQQVLLYFIFLPHQAYIQSDAISRVVFRKLVSKTKLLEWATVAQVESQNGAGRPFWQKNWLVEVVIFCLAATLFFTQPEEEALALGFLFLWACYPLVSFLISKKSNRNRKALSYDDQALLRQVGRRTWQYFETFVGAEDNWLPPDNHQEFPKPLTAHRTSPTNIGLYLLSILSARDLGYLSTAKFIERIKSTFETLKKMEQYQGHYFNWYDTTTLQPLNPKYVSAVDSGNLAGYLLALRQACLEIPQQPAIDRKIFEGLKDTLALFSEGHHLLSLPPADTFSDWAFCFKKLNHSLENAKEKVATKKRKQPEGDFLSVEKWIDTTLLQINDFRKAHEVFAPWVTDQFFHLGNKVSVAFPNQGLNWQKIITSADKNISISDLSGLYDQIIEQVREFEKNVSESPSLILELEEFIGALFSAKKQVSQFLSEIEMLSQLMDQKFKEMNFQFLVDENRGIFSIGYSVADKKFDSGFFDLLGSESRLASFIAIAKGDVPQEHWFRLGRQLVPTSGGRALISWTASMFEYLMPLLVLRSFKNTLIDETNHTVVAKQIQYGSERHVPWGISESGYNARDLQLNYQYGPFGIPGLGLKRGLSHDLVISPYSTLLASMVRPVAALKNLRALIHDKLLTDFGFYESIDYTAERLPERQKFAIIKSFMAHHQGMSLVAINNVINNNAIQDRFHGDPRVRATQLLLQERIPIGVIPVLPKAAEIEIEGEHRPAINSFVRHYTDPSGPTPRTQLLSNRNYSVMISTSGGGFSRCGDLAVTRWKEDATRDNWGSYIFVRDRSQSALWSTSHQPLGVLPQSYKVTFDEDKVEFRRRDGDISSYTQILVAPEDNVEIRHVTLTNHSTKPRILEITSYLEPVLAPAAGDLDHMAFSKLFIQTEFLSSKNALLAKRRKRMAQENENWGLHVVVSDGEILSDIQYETDRVRFVGRGRTLSDSIALSSDRNLSNTTGATLDPIFSLRIKVRVPANGKTQVAFTTGLASSREQALELADRYHDIHSFERESKIAWTKSQVDMRHLNVDSETAYLYQRLAERILYSEPSLRPPSHHRAVNTNVQSSLWPSGISGDLPIVVVRISDQKDMAIIRKLLRCHEYLRLKGLIYDFIILNEHETTYYQGLQDEIIQQVRTTGSQGWLNRPGGIYLLRSDITPEKDVAHILSVARVSLSADEPLKDQVNRKPTLEKYPLKLALTAKKRVYRPPSTVPPTLDFFNGTGGFSKDGREYIVVLKAGQWTPAPWINVIGNSQNFGFQVSESGSGFSWSINSQTNRLTPWSNDPITDPAGEIIYLRDDETGDIWTPTPLPIRSDGTYIVRHGQGYSTFELSDFGIEHELTLFVPKEDSVKVSLLKIKNISNKKRKLSITSYTEWVLGPQREKTAPYLICDVDKKSGAVFARNPHDNEFAARVAFADISGSEIKFTCSRNEFLGRNGNYIKPAALARDGLSGKKGTGQDPCAVLQTSFEIEPGEEREIVILMGQCESTEAARSMVLRYRDLNTAKAALELVTADWKNRLNRIQVKTPDAAMNILLNKWLLYQTLSCRYWSRTAFYQSGGAYGFRDQLQDCMAFVYSSPNLTREHILRSAERQFKEGDVQHWWHPPSGRGIRTRMSDDLLWLPFVVSFYVKVTGDKSILTETRPFLEAPLLKPEEEDSFTLPGISIESATIFEHCVRAIDHSLPLGQHNLPLMGTGDWNDGMNRVGRLGKGESIWLGWFLYKVLADFLPLCEKSELRNKYETHMKTLKGGLEESGWDGEWYKRAYFDDGSPLGSGANEECKIDSIAQTWAVLSNGAEPSRARQAMEKVSELLLKKQSQIVLLFEPPFDKCSQDPGYIKGYIPGVRENGGQYTHASTWVMMAFAELGDGNKAYEVFNMLNPICHSQNEEGLNKYKIEPYVMAGDVYEGESREGRGGWSWYTGSSSWFYRGCLEALLGFNLEGDKLKMTPCIPNMWTGYEISYKYGDSTYLIQVKNPKGLNGGHTAIEVDGSLLANSEINLVDDGKTHKIAITLQVSQPGESAQYLYNDQSKL